jgi:hypothetical protein
LALADAVIQVCYCFVKLAVANVVGLDAEVYWFWPSTA